MTLIVLFLNLGCVNDSTAIKEVDLEGMIPGTRHDDPHVSLLTLIIAMLVEGYYVLCDSGGALSKKIIVPYRGQRYHLKDFRYGCIDVFSSKCGLFEFSGGKADDGSGRVQNGKSDPILKKVAPLPFPPWCN